MLKCLPCLDSDGMAAARQRELMVARGRAAELGCSAVEAIQTGSYTNATRGNPSTGACSCSLPVPARSAFRRTQYCRPRNRFATVRRASW